MLTKSCYHYKDWSLLIPKMVLNSIFDEDLMDLLRFEVDAKKNITEEQQELENLSSIIIDTIQYSTVQVYKV